MTKRSMWALSCAGAVAAVAMQLYAQAPTAQIPVYNFRSAEDTRRFGMRPEDIRAGVKPDYSRLREQAVVIPAKGQVHMIAGVGGNVAMLVGDEGVVLVDTGAEAAAARVISAYQGMTTRPLRWVINTSVDDDHTGGNEVVAKTGLPGNGAGAPAPGGGGGGGRGGGLNVPTATIVAHEAVLNRMAAPTGQQSNRPVGAWPSSTFFTPKKTLFFNDEPIEIVHVPSGHSDGDLIVHFRRSDVIAAGDIYATDRFPQFDVARGGSIQGVIDGLNRIIDMTVPAFNMQGGTLVIPGHGRLSNEADVVEYRDMVTIIKERIQDMVQKRMTLAQVRAARPAFDYERIYGTASWTGDMFVEAIFNVLSRPAGRGAAR
jgi:cyclase